MISKEDAVNVRHSFILHSTSICGMSAMQMECPRLLRFISEQNRKRNHCLRELTFPRKDCASVFALFKCLLRDGETCWQYPMFMLPGSLSLRRLLFTALSVCGSTFKKFFPEKQEGSGH